MVAFTAGLERVSSHVLHRLDPLGSLLHHRLYRDACYLPGGGRCLKPLNCLGRDLDKTVIVDNTLECMGFDVGSGILIKTWRGDDDKDEELFKLIHLLKEMKEAVENNGSSVQKFLDGQLGLNKMVFG